MMPRRLFQLFIGLGLYGASMALMLRAALGLDPWDVFHQGLAGQVGLSIGMVVNLTGLAVLLLWIPLRQRPGVGTVANVILIGTAMDLTLSVLPSIGGLVPQIVALLVSVVLNGVAGALYIGAGLGPGPRDGLMTGLARRTGWSLRRVRTGIELTVLGLGWLLGGTVGVGTLLYAFTIGPLVQFFLPMVSIESPKSNTPETKPVKA
jgi:uncharacterized membrane protein YczE